MFVSFLTFTKSTFKMSTKLNFEDLENDTEIIRKVTNLQESIEKIAEMMKPALKHDVTNDMNTTEKVNYDLFTAYSLCTLYWMYLKCVGKDPNETSVKNEINRIRENMTRLKQIQDRPLRPKVNIDASKRVLKNALYENNLQPPNKRIKFDD